MKKGRKKTAGFTLVEVLVVVIIIGVLAAIVIPQFVGVSTDAKESALTANCSALRSAIEFYYHQHNGTYPGAKDSADGTAAGSDAVAVSSFSAQLTQYSNSSGVTSTTLNRTNFPYGPYIKKGIPSNPINTKSTVEVIYGSETWPAAADDNTGWVFDPASGMFAANATGSDASGNTYFSY
jgi:general secretion pathway protein G